MNEQAWITLIDGVEGDYNPFEGEQFSDELDPLKILLMYEEEGEELDF